MKQYADVRADEMVAEAEEFGACFAIAVARKEPALAKVLEKGLSPDRADAVLRAGDARKYEVVGPENGTGLGGERDCRSAVLAKDLASPFALSWIHGGEGLPGLDFRIRLDLFEEPSNANLPGIFLGGREFMEEVPTVLLSDLPGRARAVTAVQERLNLFDCGERDDRVLWQPQIEIVGPNEEAGSQRGQIDDYPTCGTECVDRLAALLGSTETAA